MYKRHETAFGLMILTTDRVGVMHDEKTRCWEKMQRENRIG